MPPDLSIYIVWRNDKFSHTATCVISTPTFELDKLLDLTVYILTSTNINQSAPDLVKMYNGHTISEELWA